MVEYERTFSWSELTSCADSEGSALITVSETADAVLLEGTFYVELVSPYSVGSDEFYRSYPLIQQQFGIALSRSVDVLASTGVQLFIPSVIGYGRDDEGNYTMNILVQSADFVEMDGAVSAIPVLDSLSVSDIEIVTSGCLVASSFTCAQIFTMTVPAECVDGEMDLSGTYQFGFSPQCRILDDGSTDPACDAFINSLDEGGLVVLEVEASFIDNCDVNLFEVTFDGDLAFYSDAAFTEEVDDESDPFVIGQDTIYGKVTVDIPDDPEGETYQFVDVSVETVWVCTAADDLSVDSDAVAAGCLSSSIDADGPYTVIGNGEVADYQGTTYDVDGNNEAAFSFLTFDTPRETINVHVQLLLTMVTDSGEVRRRRMLLQSDGDDEGNAFRSYIGTASVQEAETTDTADDGAAAFSVGFVPAMFAFTAWIWG